MTLTPLDPVALARAEAAARRDDLSVCPRTQRSPALVTLLRDERATLERAIEDCLHERAKAVLRKRVELDDAIAAMETAGLS